MDFWTRLLAGAGVKVKNQSTPATPQQRLARFQRICEQLWQIFEKAPYYEADAQTAETIRSCFQRLTAILRDEDRSPPPHLCLAHAITSQLYVTVSRIGAVAQHEGIIKDAVSLFSAFIDGEEDEDGAILATPRFAKFLMIFVDKTCGTGNLHVEQETESEIIEMLFAVTAKIRSQPDLLDAWFTTRPEDQQNRYAKKKDDFVGFTSKQDFPLCYQLIDHVHYDGRIGDFSRTGLLYIFEAASKSDSLERWIIESDLPTLMASGLGALYSQLSRKLSILLPKVELPMMLALSDYSEIEVPAEAENVYSTHLQTHMETFLSYLQFWQDVLNRCRSVDVKQTLLDHFQVLFMEQLLYPSMLESSDVDGGSSVAVLTYIRRILEVIESTELLDLTLRYLLAISEDPSGSQFLAPRSTRASRRRMTLMLQTAPDDEDDRANPSLFNLSDLIMSGTSSENPQTVAAALQLTSVLFGKGHAYCISTLVSAAVCHDTTPKRTRGALNAEIDAYLTIAAELAGEAGIDTAYEGHLHDAQHIIETHTCGSKTLSLQNFDVTQVTDGHASALGSSPSPHYLGPTDALGRHLLTLLGQFLSNNVESNLRLTETLITMIACPMLRLENWAAVSPTNYVFPEELSASADAPNQHVDALRKARRRPTWSDEHSPALLQTLRQVTADVAKLRDMVPDFQDLVNNRREALNLNDSITDAMQSAVGPSTMTSKSSAPPSPAAKAQKSPNLGPSMPTSPLTRPAAGSRGEVRPQMLDSGNATTGSPMSSPMSRQGSQRGTSTSATRPGLPRRGTSGSSAMSVRNLAHQAESRDLLRAVLTTADEGRLKRRINFPLSSNEVNGQADTSTKAMGQPVVAQDTQLDSNAQDEASVPRTGQETAEGDSGREASLSHIITNTVLLQEFILELVAILQVRASLFASTEISFT